MSLFAFNSAFKKWFAPSIAHQEIRNHNSLLAMLDSDVTIDRPLNSSKCPHCLHSFDKAPSKSKKCPSCSAFIISKRINKEPVLLTEQEANAYDSFKAKKGALKKVLSALACFNSNHMQIYQAYEKVLAEKFGYLPAADDVFWGICNEQIKYHAERYNHETLSTIYWQMAIRMHEQNKDCVHLQKESFTHKAAVLRKEASQRIEYGLHCDGLTVVGKGCAAANKMSGSIYDFSEFIKSPPIPSSECDRGWCNCALMNHYSEK